jgi:DNA modification methylase
MIQAFIRTYSKEFELVVDPFAGGGTVAVCAIKLNRVVKVYEIDIESVNLARKNLMAEVTS